MLTTKFVKVPLANAHYGFVHSIRHFFAML